jgi:hypothetical protein
MALVVVLAATFAALRDWPRMAGLLLGLVCFLLVTRRIRRAYRPPRGGFDRPKGFFVMAGNQLLVAVVIIFVGSLIGGGFVVLFSTFFGTWMIAMASLIVVMSLSGRPTK